MARQSGLLGARYASRRPARSSSPSPSVCLPPLATCSTENLFYLYALLPLAISFVAEQLRVVSAQTILDRRELESAQAVGVCPRRSSVLSSARSCAASWAS